MRALPRFGASEKLRVENGSPCSHARALVSKRGQLFPARCRSRDREYCSWCASIAYQEKVNFNDLVLTTIQPGQAAWMTLTAPSGMDLSKRALWNSLITALMTNFLHRVKMSFGDIAYVYSLEESGNKTLHVHLMLVRHEPWTEHDKSIIRQHANLVRTYSRKAKRGSELVFGRVKQVAIPSTVEHIRSISHYMLKESDVKLSNSKVARDMSTYIDGLRAVEDHRYKGTSRRSHMGGLGFRGQKVHWSKNWTLYRYVPHVPQPEMPTPESLLVVEPESPRTTVLSPGGSDRLTEDQFCEFLHQLDDPIPIE